MSDRSEIDDAAKRLLRKGDRTIARHLGTLVLWGALFAAGFVLGAFLL